MAPHTRQDTEPPQVHQHLGDGQHEFLSVCGSVPNFSSALNPAKKQIARKSKSTKLCPLVGSGILHVDLKTILCLVLDLQGMYIYIYKYNILPSEHSA